MYFQLENPTKSRKNVISAKIKRMIRNNEDFKTEEAFWFTLPSVDAHRNHPVVEISAVEETVDPADSDDIIPEENHEECEGADIYGELEERRKLIEECNSHMRNLGSVLWMLPESALLELEKDLVELAEKMQERVIHDNSAGLPLEVYEYERNCNGMPMGKVKKVKTSKGAKKKQKRA